MSLLLLGDPTQTAGKRNAIYLHNVHPERFLLVNVICGFTVLSEVIHFLNLWMSNATERAAQARTCSVQYYRSGRALTDSDK